MVTPRIAVVVADDVLRETVAEVLENEGCVVARVSDPIGATPDVDLVLVEGRGLSMLPEQLRDKPVGVLGRPRHEPGLAFELPVPFELSSLLAAVAASLRLPLDERGERRAATIQRYFRSLGALDLESLRATCADDVVYALPEGAPFAATVCGREAFCAYTAKTFASFPGVTFSAVEVFALPSALVARYHGSWLGADGTVRELPGEVVFELDADDRIRRIGVNVDGRQLNRMIGGASA